jgi:prolipoprotein diacylglyceryltransferase
MKKSDWVFGIAFILMGLSCFIMSAVSVSNPESFGVYIANILRICAKILIPMLLIGIVIWFVRRKRG